MAEAFVDHCQIRTGGDMVGIQLGDAHPVCEGFLRVLVLDIKFGGLQKRLDGFLNIPNPLGKLSHFLQRDRVIGCGLGSLLINLERLVVTLQLEQGQSQAGERLGVVRELFERLPVGRGSLVPLLIPGHRVSHAHRFLENVFASRHVFLKRFGIEFYE